MTIRHAHEAIARDQLRKHDIHTAEAGMTFEEWNAGRDKTIQPAVFDAKFEAVARAAWEAATAAERERCARTTCIYGGEHGI